MTTQTGPVVQLRYPPECVLVRLDRPSGIKLTDLADNIAPVVPFERRYTIPANNGKGNASKSIIRRQIPLTPAYSLTDYRSQGQTMSAVIVDIGKPPSGGITPFNAYVALSRSSGRDTIRLLRDFKDVLFTKVPCHKLVAEDERLRNLNASTFHAYTNKEIW
ncbi:hypothetical protein BDV93DRAFT_502254 [Ceratobasidium sp. AG-I]|nr:hypothetical protein BDV93DRAFT_502254 [Ceratobasidium sp. AG-I]